MTINQYKYLHKVEENEIESLEREAEFFKHLLNEVWPVLSFLFK